MINYSFIIPHKNTPDLLRKCIDSIPHRDDVQIIVVDDNSDVDKVDFEHFPGLNENCTEVYLTKEGKGAGYARNVGLKYAVGKWIVFADADDFFHLSISLVMNEFISCNSDIVFFGGDAIKIPSGEPSNRCDLYNKAFDCAIKTGDPSKLFLMSSPWRKFINRHFLQIFDIKFNETQWSNDVVFMAKVAFCAETYEFSSHIVYCTTEQESSLTKNHSLRCKSIRYLEECKAVKILKHKYGYIEDLFYWQFFSWMEIYKLNKIHAFFLLPHALFTGGMSFIKQMFRAKFSR